MTVLVTGGAGYIGSHVVRLLSERGDDVVVLDSLATGDTGRIGNAALERIDLAADSAPAEISRLAREHAVTSVIHLAALKQAGQSVEQPARYYSENVGGLANLLRGLEGSDVSTFVFSSSAAVYGNPGDGLVTEETPTHPINPYGETKLAGEWLVEAAGKATGIRTVSLRYFNVAGAGWPELGDTVPMNLLTLAIDAVHRGEQPKIFGDDYETPDRTGVRDYVHVLDLAEAHLAALDNLTGNSATASPVFNVGTGSGASVLTVLNTLATVSGRRIEPAVVGRRAGDPASVVADVSLIERELGWRSTRGLDHMVASAWESSLHQAGRTVA